MGEYTLYPDADDRRESVGNVVANNGRCVDRDTTVCTPTTSNGREVVTSGEGSQRSERTLID